MKITLQIALFILLFFSIPLYAQEDPQKKASPKTLEIYKMSNEDLTKQSESLFKEISAKFFTQLRGVYTYEDAVDKVKKEISAIRIPKKQIQKIADKKGTESVQLAKAEAKYAKSRVDLIKYLLEQMAVKKELVDILIKKSGRAISFAANFINTIDELNIYQVEIKWRIKDGTISQDMVPDFMDENKMNTQKQKIIQQKKELEKKSVTARKEMEALIAITEKTKNNLIEAKAHLTSVNEKYSYELKRWKLEKEYAKQSSESLMAHLLQLQEERVWINGSFNLSMGQFLKTKANAAAIQKQIDSASNPMQQRLIQSQEKKQKIKRIESIINFHTEHVERLVSLRLALESLIKTSEAFQGDAIVLSEHVFKMQAIAKILERAAKQGKFPTDSIPVNIRIESLIKAGDTISEFISDAITATGKSRERLQKIDDDIKKSEDEQKEARKQLTALHKVYEANLQAQKWEDILKDLAAQDIVLKFEETSEKLIQNEDIIRSKKVEYEKASTFKVVLPIFFEV